MAVTKTQAPHLPFNMAYGPNPITLSGLEIDQDKYVVQIFKQGEQIPIADLRQTPNKLGVAIFDIQNTLQTIISPSTNNLDALNYDSFAVDTSLSIAHGELQQYQIKIGYEAGNNVVTSYLPDFYTTLGGKQPYWMVEFNTDNYIPKVYGTEDILSCTGVSRYARALSDNQWTMSKFDVEDELLQDFTSNWFAPLIDVHNVYPDDQCTKSFYNLLDRDASAPPNANTQGIEGYYIASYGDGSQNFDIEFIPNTIAYGGGPNTSIGDGIEPTSNYLINTIATGPANLPVTLDPATTHYYVIPTAYSPECATQYGDAVIEGAVWRAQRYNIIQEDCNDYPHIQFAWMNSYGLRDQFTFTKRNERSVKIGRNEYLKEAADYNSNRYSVDIQNRGFTTYSQTLKETYTATTGYITDVQAKLLESLYTSADVMVRFSDGELENKWQPVRLQSMNYVEKTNRKDRLFQYTLNFTLAHNIKSQRG